jgi:hypothetical protein
MKRKIHKIQSPSNPGKSKSLALVLASANQPEEVIAELQTAA